MPTSIDAVVDERGNVRLLQAMRLPSPRRAIVTILEEGAETPASDAAAADSGIAPWTTRYEPIRTIGRGGMSVVHLARDRRSGDIVCVKELQDTVRRSSLQQECRALARLRHPGILRLLNFETRGDRPYLVLEYGAGLSLVEYMRLGATAQAPIAMGLAERLFDAVGTAHEEGVIHRDLKPENVLVHESDHTLWPRILDFGLAVVDQFDDRNAVTSVGVAAGTPAYMAPEQIRAEELSGACDVYAVGVMAWEMLTGRRAFSGAPPQILRDKLASESLTLDAPLLAVDGAFAELIGRCTRREPAGRPSAREACATLQALAPALPQQASLVPVNLTFGDRAGDRPSGWFDGLGYVYGVSVWYSSRVEIDASGRASARLERAESHADEFGVLMQRIPAAHLASATVRLQAELRADRIERRAGLWLRADAGEISVAFDNMHDRPVRGTTDWTAHSVEIDLPPATAWLNFGILLAGPGAVSMREVQLSSRTRSGSWIPLGLPHIGAQAPTEVRGRKPSA